jgi:hypothetical protein
LVAEWTTTSKPNRRTLNPRRSERIVDDRVFRSRAIAATASVDELQQRIRRRFDPDHPRVGAQIASSSELENGR